MTTALQLGLTDGARNTFQKTIPYVNPSATNYKLKTFANALYSLSDDTLGDIVRIDKEDITNATNE